MAPRVISNALSNEQLTSPSVWQWRRLREWMAERSKSGSLIWGYSVQVDSLRGADQFAHFLTEFNDVHNHLGFEPRRASTCHTASQATLPAFASADLCSEIFIVIRLSLMREKTNRLLRKEVGVPTDRVVAAILCMIGCPEAWKPRNPPDVSIFNFGGMTDIRLGRRALSTWQAQGKDNCLLYLFLSMADSDIKSWEETPPFNMLPFPKKTATRKSP